MSTEELIELLIEWIAMPNWATSEAFLRQHESDLLTDAATDVLAVFQRSNPADMAVLQHIDLLEDCRIHGITEAYQERLSGTGGAIDPEQADRLLLVALMNVNSLAELAAMLDQLVEGAPEQMVAAAEAYLPTVEDEYVAAGIEERLVILRQLIASAGSPDNGVLS